MRYRELFEADFDYDLDDEEDNAPRPALNLTQQRLLTRHQKKQDRGTFRSAEQRRRHKEQEMFEPEDDSYQVRRSRHVPKSAVGYKPFKWPMIRIGLFREQSRIGLDAELRRELGNATSEAGVSCFRSMEHQGGYLILEHHGESSWHFGGFDPAKLLYPHLQNLRRQFDRWQRDGSPMDIFMLRGHLVSFGNQNEWLSTGADGEYLLDIRKPHQMERVDPDHLWLHDRVSLRQYYETTRKPSDKDDDDF